MSILVYEGKLPQSVTGRAALKSSHRLFVYRGRFKHAEFVLYDSFML